MNLSSSSTTKLYFPLWRYLNQPLWDSAYPLVLNPHKYWLQYNTEHLNRCLHNVFLEQCWQVNYPDFVTLHHAFCDRIPLEEDPVWLLDRCWQRERYRQHSFHPEGYFLEEKSS